MSMECSINSACSRTQPSLQRLMPGVVAAAMLLTGSVHAASLPWRDSGLVADHVVLQRGSDDVLETSRVSISSDGLRIDASDGGMRALVNFRSEKMWLIDRLRGIRHQIPTSEDPGDSHYAPEQDPFVLAPGVKTGLDTGILSPVACDGLVASDAFEARWRGRDVTIYTCRGPDGTPLVRHWYSDEIGMVVRTMNVRGRIEELRNIVPVAIPPSRFEVDERLRPVQILEFLLGSSLLQPYGASTGGSNNAVNDK